MNKDKDKKAQRYKDWTTERKKDRKGGQQGKEGEVTTTFDLLI